MAKGKADAAAGANQIATSATIKDVKITPECGKLNFNGFDFTPGQYRRLAELVKNKEEVTITIQLKQGHLFGKDEDIESSDE